MFTITDDKVYVFESHNRDEVTSMVTLNISGTHLHFNLLCVLVLEAAGYIELESTLDMATNHRQSCSFQNELFF